MGAATGEWLLTKKTPDLRLSRLSLAGTVVHGV